MKVVLARIDERLMHGIVLTQYLPSSGAKRIMVIDDDVANNPLRKDAMMMAKPAGYAASIIPLEKALTNIKAHKYDGQKVFLLARRVETMLALQEVGVEIPELIIGCTELMNEGVKLSSRAFLSEEDVNTCKKISEHGTRIVSQFASTDTKTDIWKIINK
jgi:PTS system mannose-specific IIB component